MYPDRFSKGLKTKRKHLSGGQCLPACSLLCGLLANWWCLKEEEEEEEEGGGEGAVGVARQGQSVRALGPNSTPVAPMG